MSYARWRFRGEEKEEEKTTLVMVGPATSNKPANTLFKQQRLAAWQPIMSPPYVSACFIVVAAIFVPIGFAIYSANNKVVDSEFRYDHFRKCTPNNNDAVFVYNLSGFNTKMGCITPVNFTVSEDLSPPIYMYYKLDNFYQNHRRYAKSRNEKQISGDAVPSSDMSDCSPLRNPGENNGMGGIPITVNGETMQYDSMVYSPAGLVAWSMFNDTFKLYYINKTSDTLDLVCDGSNFNVSTGEPFPLVPGTQGNTRILANSSRCHKRGIAWDSDHDTKFKRPAMSNNIWTAKRSLYGLRPLDIPAIVYPNTSDVFYANGWYAGEAGHRVPVTTDEDLMVWMRTASLPSFRKLYRIIDVPIPAGEYMMVITEQYDVSPFEGKKSFVVATVSWVGGKNTFLAGAYLGVGFAALLVGIIFFAVHKLYGDRTQVAIESLNDLQ